MAHWCNSELFISDKASVNPLNYSSGARPRRNAYPGRIIFNKETLGIRASAYQAMNDEDRPSFSGRSEKAPQWADDWEDVEPSLRTRAGGERKQYSRKGIPDRDEGRHALPGRGAAPVRRDSSLCRGLERRSQSSIMGHVSTEQKSRPISDRSGWINEVKGPDPSERRRQSTLTQHETGDEAYKAKTVAPVQLVKPEPLPVVREQRSVKGTFFHGSSFKDIGASAEVISSLTSIGVTKPSHIQVEAYRLLLDKGLQHVAIMDQAGSGKTLAYLLPLLQVIREEEKRAQTAMEEGRESALPSVSKAPKLIVLAPTTELVQQVFRVAKALSAAGRESGFRFRSACMTGGDEDRDRRAKSWRTQVSQLSDGLDLVVATPGRMLEHLQAKTLDLSCCKAIVLDEVDVLLGDQAAFNPQIDPLRDAAPSNLRFVLVTATLPQHTLALVRQGFPDISLAMGPGLHRTAAGLEEELIDCSGGEEISLEAGTQRKLDTLGTVLSRRSAGRVLIFCNKIENCRSVENHLLREDRQGKKYKVLVYHEAIRDELRASNLNAFLQPIKEGGAPVILVATDRMSRGIDSMYCEHVILFDFPRDPSEYVRRVGRTARGAGGRGTVSVLALGRQVPLAKDIMNGNEKGRPVHKLPEVE